MNLMYMHYRPKGKPTKGGATVAILPNDAENTATLAIAWCSKHDNFDKKVGRDIASGRLKAIVGGRKTRRHFIKVVPIDVYNVKTSVAEQLAETMAGEGLE